MKQAGRQAQSFSSFNNHLMLLLMWSFHGFCFTLRISASVGRKLQGAAGTAWSLLSGVFTLSDPGQCYTLLSPLAQPLVTVFFPWDRPMTLQCTLTRKILVSRWSSGKCSVRTGDLSPPDILLTASLGVTSNTSRSVYWQIAPIVILWSIAMWTDPRYQDDK